MVSNFVHQVSLEWMNLYTAGPMRQELSMTWTKM
jgi:hypothetical protein